MRRAGLRALGFMPPLVDAHALPPKQTQSAPASGRFLFVPTPPAHAAEGHMLSISSFRGGIRLWVPIGHLASPC